MNKIELVYFFIYITPTSGFCSVVLKMDEVSSETCIVYVEENFNLLEKLSE